MNESVTSENGEFIAINQGDGNFVVYERFRDGSLGPPAWDMWSYKSSHGNGESSPPQVPPQNPPERDDQPISNIPSPAEIVGIPTLIAQNVNPIGMSYWRNINQHKGQDILKVFLSINDELTLFTIDKRNLQILSQRSLQIHHTGESCYFSAIQPDMLYIPREDTLYRVNVETGAGDVAWRLTDGNKLWQCHSSYNDDVHSATIQDADYHFIKWGVSIRGETKYYEMGKEPDECQIDKSGKWLVIKEDDYNRITNLESNAEIMITNRDGALGHSDCGFECMIGENDMSNSPGALDLINFKTGEHRFMYSTGIWNMGYVSFTNAKPNVEGQRCLVSTPNDLILINFDWPHQWTHVCPNLTESQEYAYRAKANLCPQGEFAAWTAFVNGSLNAYIVRVPSL